MKRLIIPSLLALMAVGLSSQARAGVSFGITINDHFPHVPVPHVVVTPPCPPPVVVAQPQPRVVIVEPQRYEYVRECDRVEYRYGHGHYSHPAPRYERYERYNRHERDRHDYGHRR